MSGISGIPDVALMWRCVTRFATGSIGRAIEAGVDSIEHGYGLRSRKLIGEMAKKRVFFVPSEEAEDDPTIIRSTSVWN